MGKRKDKRDNAMRIILKLYGTKTKLADIAEQAHVSLDTVVRWLKEDGVPKRPVGYCQHQTGALSSVTDEQLIAWHHNEEKSLKLIGDMFDLTRERVRQVFVQRGVEVIDRRSFANGHPTKITKEELEAAIANPDLWSHTSVTNHLQIAQETLDRYCEYYGIEVDWRQMYKDKRQPSFPLDRAIELYNSGMSFLNVGKEMGVTFTLIHREFVIQGIPRRPVGSKPNYGK